MIHECEKNLLRSPTAAAWKQTPPEVDNIIWNKTLLIRMVLALAINQVIEWRGCCRNL